MAESSTKNFQRGIDLPLSTPRLILRDFVSSDIPKIVEIVHNPQFTGFRRFRREYAEADVEKFIAEAIAFQRPANGPREIYRLAVCLKTNPNEVIGYCVFHGWNQIPDDDDDQAGYFIDPEYQGHGYATEAMHSVLRIYFAQHPNRKVCAHAHPDNPASQKVLKKLGFSENRSITIDVYGHAEPRLLFTLEASKLK